MSQRNKYAAVDRRGTSEAPRKITPNPPRPSKPLLAFAVLLLAGWLAVLAILAVTG